MVPEGDAWAPTSGLRGRLGRAGRRGGLVGGEGLGGGEAIVGGNGYQELAGPRSASASETVPRETKAYPPLGRRSQSALTALDDRAPQVPDQLDTLGRAKRER